MTRHFHTIRNLQKKRYTTNIEIQLSFTGIDADIDLVRNIHDKLTPPCNTGSRP